LGRLLLLLRCCFPARTDISPLLLLISLLLLLLLPLLLISSHWNRQCRRQLSQQYVNHSKRPLLGRVQQLRVLLLSGAGRH
jgi:hypothetical protein